MSKEKEQRVFEACDMIADGASIYIALKACGLTEREISENDEYSQMVYGAQASREKKIYQALLKTGDPNTLLNLLSECRADLGELRSHKPKPCGKGGMQPLDRSGTTEPVYEPLSQRKSVKYHDEPHPFDSMNSGMNGNIREVEKKMRGQK